MSLSQYQDSPDTVLGTALDWLVPLNTETHPRFQGLLGNVLLLMVTIQALPLGSPSSVSLKSSIIVTSFNEQVD